LVAGTIFKGDTWVTSAPSDRRGSVPKGRIRLSAFGRDAYLGEAVIAVRDAIRKLEGVIRSGGLRPEAVDEPYERTMRDFFVASGAYVVFQTKRPSSDGTD
jgi:hypothetical protein